MDSQNQQVEQRNDPCVYRIICTANGHFYIGSTITPFGRKGRKQRHWEKLSIGKHVNSRIQRTWNKWGRDYFKFEIVEWCKAEDRIQIEQKYIDKHFDNPFCMNLNPIASKPPSAKGRKLSKKVREQISRRLKLKWQDEKYRKYMIKVVGDANRGKIMSEEARRKMRANSANKKPVIQYRDGSGIVEWPSAASAERALGIKHIREVCNGSRKSAGGFGWRWAS